MTGGGTVEILKQNLDALFYNLIFGTNSSEMFRKSGDKVNKKNFLIKTIKFDFNKKNNSFSIKSKKKKEEIHSLIDEDITLSINDIQSSTTISDIIKNIWWVRQGLNL